MLIEFSVSNYKSIRGEVTFSLVADGGSERWDTNVFEPELAAGVRSIPLVTTAAIYGANAAGKTNLVRALATMGVVVTQSARGLDELPLTPFLFDPATRDKPTNLEVTIVADGVRYQYGFSATKERVVGEWLYAWPRGRVQRWFERDEDAYRFGDKLSGDKEVWRRATRPDALFLSTAVGLNSDRLRPVFDWFARRLHVGGIDGWFPTFSAKCCEDDRKEGILRFLRSADLAISDVTVHKEDFHPEMLPEEMPAPLRESLKEDLRGTEVASVRLTHETPNGFGGELDLEEESDGTQKMFMLAGPWLDALEHGFVVMLDELHDNLHPHLVRFLVNCFHDPRANRFGAQLVFSTHDTSILSQDVFRRDQIWFCERGEDQGTRVYGLNEFRPRKGVVNLEKAYLSGRFGALPFVSDGAVTVDDGRE